MSVDEIQQGLNGRNMEKMVVAIESKEGSEILKEQHDVAFFKQHMSFFVKHKL